MDHEIHETESKKFFSCENPRSQGEKEMTHQDTIRKIFIDALDILAESGTESPEFNYAYLVIQAYRHYVVDKRVQSIGEDKTDDFLNRCC